MPESVDSADASTTVVMPGFAPANGMLPVVSDDDDAADLDAGADGPVDAATLMDASPRDAGMADDAEDAGPIDSGSPVDSGSPIGSSAPTSPTGPTLNTPPTATAPAADSCSRARLLQNADLYLKALSDGDTSELTLHPKARYTENGQQQTLGLGLWLDFPQTQFARHVVDESSCSSATEAVLRGLSRVVLGLRLHYGDQQLIEVEAQVVRSNDQYWAPDEIIVKGTDAWTEPLPVMERNSATELKQVAMNYFDSVSVSSLQPPHAASCERRQNGAPIPPRGDCGARPGTQRFQQQRYPVIDETAGVITAIVKYSDFIGMYLFKVRAGTIEDIEVIGGASSNTTGW